MAATTFKTGPHGAFRKKWHNECNPTSSTGTSEDFGEGTPCAYRAHAPTSAFYHAWSVPGCSIFTKPKEISGTTLFILQRERSLIRVSSTTSWHGPAILPRSSFPWPSWPRMNSCFLVLKLSRSQAPHFRTLTTPYNGITTIIIKPTGFTHFSFQYPNNLRLILQLGPLAASKGQRLTASKVHQCTITVVKHFHLVLQRVASSPRKFQSFLHLVPVQPRGTLVA